MPRPRNDSDASARIAKATLSEAWTTIGRGGVRQHVAPGDAPAGRAQRAGRVHVLARRDREHLPAHEPGEGGRVDHAERDHHAGEPGARAPRPAPGPAPAAGTTAPRPSAASAGRRPARPRSRRAGRAARRPAPRCATEPKPATSETRVPQITRESTSRPTLSVPSEVGAARGGPACCRGSASAGRGAPPAARASATSDRQQQHRGAERAPGARGRRAAGCSSAGRGERAARAPRGWWPRRQRCRIRGSIQP